MPNSCVIRRSLAGALLGASLAAFGGVAAAPAADLAPRSYVKAQPPAEPANDWSGFYAGVHAGYGWGQSPTTVTPDPTEAFLLVRVGGAPVPDTSRISGALGGGQIGYNFQYAGFVAGIEADISGASWRSSGAVTGPLTMLNQFTTAVSTKLDWFGTVRGRLGALVAPSLLVYGTGGLAYGEVNTSVVGTNAYFNCSGASLYCASGATSGLSVGWSAGAGMEYGFAPAWSLKAEYLHVDLGDRSVTYQDHVVVLGNPPSFLTARNSFRADTIQVGLNYRFGR